MKAHIVYCHPSENSFTKSVCDAFTRGIGDSGNDFDLTDLYGTAFSSDMAEKEYLRDAWYRNTPDLSEDVLAEQRKINDSDALVFIYPLFWTDTPAKLKGWFDRVWSYGFAYGERTMKQLEKGLILCIAGHSIETLEKFGFLQSMKNVMIGDRLSSRVKHTEFIVFDETTKKALNADRRESFLEEAYGRGKTLFESGPEKNRLDGRIFTAVENSEAGEVDTSTIFLYHQKDDIVWAEYQGGDIVKGSLVGTIQDHALSFSYQHVNIRKEVRTGTCRSRIEIMDNGRLRLVESWKWSTGERGNSVIQEI